MITATIKFDQRMVELTREYLFHSGLAHREDVQKYGDKKTHRNHLLVHVVVANIQNTSESSRETSNAQIGPGIDSERDHVLQHTTGQYNKRGIWSKQWLMIQNCVALNTTFKENRKQYTFRAPSVKEKQLDFVVIDRRNGTHCSDAEANDMIHLGK